jgi:hypothetical protein
MNTTAQKQGRRSLVLAATQLGLFMATSFGDGYGKPYPYNL